MAVPLTGGDGQPGHGENIKGKLKMTKKVPGTKFVKLKAKHFSYFSSFQEFFQEVQA